ncbi:hypothetical protein [Enterobacillus tribolii]|uniref:hypothetical protein n=1 Tax=Enterobacillus tribolii TaxID=1487935 RepID=UPI0011C06D18|nr:hypothetical protein [Enterobacillus tribolii]MBW7983432.1 hypothetical protein [Enterobacillus tribolii]
MRKVLVSVVSAMALFFISVSVSKAQAAWSGWLLHSSTTTTCTYGQVYYNPNGSVGGKNYRTIHKKAWEICRAAI